MPRPVLDPRQARTFYNVADALVAGSADLDLVPWVEKELAGRSRAERRAVRCFLRWIEWQPVLQLRCLRGFSWLSPQDRRDLLAAWEHSRLRVRRQAVGRLAALIREGYSRLGA